MPSKKSTLIGSYSILDTDAKTVARKPSREDALNLLSEYYKSHRSELPGAIRNSRETILALLMDGLPAEEAFKEAILGGA